MAQRNAGASECDSQPKQVRQAHKLHPRRDDHTQRCALPEAEYPGFHPVQRQKPPCNEKEHDPVPPWGVEDRDDQHGQGKPDTEEERQRRCAG